MGKTDDEAWSWLANARVMVWFCPDREAHGQRPGKMSDGRPTVEWNDGVAHCLHPGCGRTSGS